MVNTPNSCSQCRGELEARIIIKEFSHEYAQYGHASCGKCGITFDSNVNEISETKLDSANDLDELSEQDYRNLFVESSKIADEEDNIYATYNWDDNDALKYLSLIHI